MNETKFETRELSGNLKKSSVKTKENQPDMFGECRINGVLYDISGWTKLSQSGNKYLSLAFQDKEKYKAEMQEKAKASDKAEITNSDVDFLS
tara:strand:- start:548 stop:823 length:276 start_codon:yes stop_codon:yes gene_type:complete